MLSSPTVSVISLPKDVLEGDTIYYIDSLHNTYPIGLAASSSGIANNPDIEEIAPSSDDFPPLLLNPDIP